MSPADFPAYGLAIVRARPWVLGAWEYRQEYLPKLGVREAMDSLSRAAAASTGEWERAR